MRIDGEIAVGVARRAPVRRRPDLHLAAERELEAGRFAQMQQGHPLGAGAQEQRLARAEVAVAQDVGRPRLAVLEVEFEPAIDLPRVGGALRAKVGASATPRGRIAPAAMAR